MKYLVPILLVTIIILIGGLAFFMGRSSKTGVPDASLTPTSSPTQADKQTTLTPTPTVATKKVTGGGILSFPKYELTIPSDWEASREVPGPDSEKVIIKKGGYQVSILEGGFGGSVCLYPGDADFEGPSARYEEFVEITTKSGDLLRRSWTGGSGFAICQKTQYGWNAPSLFGHISISTPASYSSQEISEIDKILASFNKI